MRTFLQLAVFVLLPAGLAVAGGGYQLVTATVDSGGGASAGAGYTLRGTAGQPDTGRSFGTSNAVIGGFWPAAVGGGVVVPEGEGTADGEGDGTPEGEGQAEGTPEGEGFADGEGEGAGGGSCTPGAVHSADTGAPINVIGLQELLRVIQFFNSTRFGCQAGTVDGYAPGSTNESCCPHDSDFDGPANWRISLPELLRLIQFFNSGGYAACPASGTADGFCPGAPGP